VSELSEANTMEAKQAPEYLINAHHVVKRFGATTALRGVDFQAQPGEIVALIGHNGAGKSTLLRCIGGFVKPTSGHVALGGRDFSTLTVHTARTEGVRSVRQELSLSTSLSAVESVRLLYPKLYHGQGSGKRAAEAVSALFYEMYGVQSLNPKQLLYSYNFAERQMLEVCLAFLDHDTSECRAVIMDEATSSLDARVTSRLYSWIGRVARSDEVAVLVTTHLLHEITGLADRAVVMADGAVVGELEGDAITQDRLVGMMGASALGAPVTQAHQNGGSAAGSGSRGQASQPGSPDAGRTLLALDNAEFPPLLESVTMHVRAGEIVGLGGLEGHGQAELLLKIFERNGNLKGKGGGADVQPPRVAFVGSDPRSEGVFPYSSIRWNISIGGRRLLRRAGFVLKKEERSAVDVQLTRLSVRGHADQIVSELSGGNQQKTVLARAMLANPDLYLLSDPTRGIDFNTKMEIYGVFQELASRGAGVLWYSTELAELTRCDRVYIMRSGRTVAQLEGDEARNEQMLELSFASAALAEPLGEDLVREPD
jgi:ribose transport system ATP-binding protein